MMNTRVRTGLAAAGIALGAFAAASTVTTSMVEAGGRDPVPCMDDKDAPGCPHEGDGGGDPCGTRPRGGTNGTMVISYEGCSTGIHWFTLANGSGDPARDAWSLESFLNHDIHGGWLPGQLQCSVAGKTAACERI